MPSTRRLRRLQISALTAAAALVAVGCSGKGAEPAKPASEAAGSELPVAASPDGKVGLSPGGVTTRIDVPAQSTEEQYAQACLNAKDWMAAQGGDPDTLVEPFLKNVQASSQAGPAAFGKTWPQLSEAEQAAVIIAVRAAADGGC